MMKKLFPSLVILVFAVVFWVVGRGGGERGSGVEKMRKVGAEVIEGGWEAGGVLRDRKKVERAEIYEEARAYRLVLDGGVCRLEAVDELEGEFRGERWMQAGEGMFYCRLLGKGGDVLAETTMHPPDRQCVVQVPVDGKLVPMRMTGDGPVVFQVRMPKLEGAVSLEIVRLSGEAVPDDGSRPLGELVAMIDLLGL